MLSDLREFILDDSAVSNMVGSRMFPLTLPQSVVYPALSYQQVSKVRERSLCGPAGYAHARITINAWAKNYSDAHALATAVRQRLDGFHGKIDQSPEVEVGSIVLDNEFDDFEEAAGMSGIYRVLMDYIVSHPED